jgi:hypothetical protein
LARHWRLVFPSNRHVQASVAIPGPGTLAVGGIATAVASLLLLFQLLWNFELASRRRMLTRPDPKVRRWPPEPAFLAGTTETQPKK